MCSTRCSLMLYGRCYTKHNNSHDMYSFLCVFLQIRCAGYAIDGFGGWFTFSNRGEARGNSATQSWSQVWLYNPGAKPGVTTQPKCAGTCDVISLAGAAHSHFVSAQAAHRVCKASAIQNAKTCMTCVRFVCFVCKFVVQAILSRHLVGSSLF